MFKLTGLTLADVDLKLGSTERVTRLFAYPNNCNVICLRNWTLEQTVTHYLNQSVQRDGYANAKVLVKTDNDQLYAEITGVPKGYDKPLSALLDAVIWPTPAPASSTPTASGPTVGICSCRWAWLWRTAKASSCCTSRRITR